MLGFWDVQAFFRGLGFWGVEAFFRGLGFCFFFVFLKGWFGGSLLGNLKRHHSTDQHATALQQLAVETKDVAPSMGGRRKVASMMQCLGFCGLRG